MRCQACGFDLTPSAKFCSECGEPVARGEPPPSSGTAQSEVAPTTLDGERRQLTVIFADLVGSTAMASRLDPEDWRDVVSAYQTACSGVVERFGGYVAQYLGDGLVVYFGYPTAHEDDALRAVRAGLGMLEAVKAQNPRLSRHGVSLSVRIGVHTGTVVVGEVGSSMRKETLALGDTTNLAARLQEVAEADTVVVSSATFRLVRSQFVMTERGVHKLKGIEKPVHVYRALQPVRLRSTTSSGRTAKVDDLVGRIEELRTLRECWKEAREGRGQVVAISGEAGIGKSRLASALHAELGNVPHTWLECRASSYMQDTPLHSIIALQEDAFGLAAFEKPEQRSAWIERAIVQAGMDANEHLPLLAELHGLPVPARFSPPARSPEATRRRTLESLVEWFLRVSDQQPLVVLVEDLHWVDPSTLELVERLVSRIATHPVLLILTHRPSFTPSWPATANSTAIPLARLGKEDAADLVARLESARGKLPEGVVQEIMNRSDGVPLFLEELTKTVLEAEAAEEPGKRGRRATVPTTLQDSLMARLDQLGGAKELVQLCATFGREFSLEVVRATTSLSPEELSEALNRLVSAELLTRRGDPPIYSFRHALLQEQAYDSLLNAVRQGLHRKIAEVLSAKFPAVASREPELLAHHYDGAGLYEPALGFWLQAGQKSIGRSANVEASRQLKRGLDCLERLPDSPTRDQQELLLLTMRGVALIANEGYGADEVERAFARARALCQKLGDTPHLFPVLFGLCLFYLVRAKGPEAQELAAQLDAIASATGDLEVTLETHSARAALAFWEGKFAAANEHILRARTLFDPQKHGYHVFVYGQDPLAYGYSYGSLALWFLGYPEQAMASAERAVELAGKTNHPLTIAGILSFYGDLHHHLRKPAAFDDIAKRTVAISQEQNLPMWVGTARTQRGWAMCQLGDPTHGVEEILAGLEAFRRTGAEVNTPYMISRLVEALITADRLDEGLSQVEGALSILETKLDRYYEAELHRLRGEILARKGNASGAEACFERALAVSRAQAAKSLELRASMSLGRLRAAAGRAADARELLRPVYDWFTEGLDTPDLVDAKTLLATWSARA
ncbi:MAG TPA: adenylate/guanylate cyclase domain-containing protein [Polyangiaceae bacterium]|nr:adenylate/guanylate cyclase domain-containing protein [Polyangiaceae bacterium]